MMSTDSAVAREAFHVPTQLLKDVPHCMKTYQNESTPVRTTTGGLIENPPFFGPGFLG